MSRAAKNVIEYRIYEMEPEKPYVCLSGEEWRISDTPSDRLHFHNCIEIGYCFSDHGSIAFEDERTVPFKARDIFLIPRFVPHTTYSSPGCSSRWSYLFVDLDAAGMHNALGGAQDAPCLSKLLGSHLRITASSHQRLYFLCKCMLEEAQKTEKTDSSLFTLYALLLSAELRAMFSAHSPRTVSDNRTFVLRPALEYIQNHYAQICSVTKLAELCHLSSTHFRRQFLAVMGMPPLQYVIHTRIRHACNLLSTTSESIADISRSVGIRSISSFNRSFQNIMHVSPQQYRLSCAPPTARQQKVLAFDGWIIPDEEYSL